MSRTSGIDLGQVPQEIPQSVHDARVHDGAEKPPEKPHDDDAELSRVTTDESHVDRVARDQATPRARFIAAAGDAVRDGALDRDRALMRSAMRVLDELVEGREIEEAPAVVDLARHRRDRERGE